MCLTGHCICKDCKETKYCNNCPNCNICISSNCNQNCEGDKK